MELGLPWLRAGSAWVFADGSFNVKHLFKDKTKVEAAFGIEPRRVAFF